MTLTELISHPNSKIVMGLSLLLFSYSAHNVNKIDLCGIQASNLFFVWGALNLLNGVSAHYRARFFSNDIEMPTHDFTISVENIHHKPY